MVNYRHMQFSISRHSKQSAARRGLLQLRHGVVQTPFFMPIATRAAVRNISTADVEKLQAQIILSNTYHLLVNPGPQHIKQFGGLHQFMQWDKPILTDSGGFQVFSLAKHRQITQRGVTFRVPESGDKHVLTPEKVVQIQAQLGVDISMVLDECPPYPASKQAVSRAVTITTDWAARSQTAYKKLSAAHRRGRGLFGIVQGGVHQDLRQRSAAELVELGFDGYAIGGVAVGEPREHLPEILNWVAPQLPADKPRYLMGLGRPEEIVTAVKMGIDMFDCVIPTREGRHGRLFVWQHRNLNRVDFYDTFKVDRLPHKHNKKPINPQSRFTELRQYSWGYLHFLFKTNELLGLRLAALHNLEFYLELMAQLRKDIWAGKV